MCECISVEAIKINAVARHTPKWPLTTSLVVFVWWPTRTSCTCSTVAIAIRQCFFFIFLVWYFRRVPTILNYVLKGDHLLFNFTSCIAIAGYYYMVYGYELMIYLYAEWMKIDVVRTKSTNFTFHKGKTVCDRLFAINKCSSILIFVFNLYCCR